MVKGKGVADGYSFFMRAFIKQYVLRNKHGLCFALIQVLSSNATHLKEKQVLYSADNCPITFCLRRNTNES